MSTKETRPDHSATVVVFTSGTTLADVVAVARYNARFELSEDARERVSTVRRRIDALAASEVPAYGISTGFGALANKHVPLEKRTLLQKSLIRSHAAGIGPIVEREVVRALMFLRAETLASGHTGIRVETLQTMLDILNAGITPVVHEFGSLGCSGDLAPLAHCALALMGEGRAMGPDGEERPFAELLAEAGISSMTLAEKEGLALINGTDGMLGQFVMALNDLHELFTVADVTAALSVEGLLGTDRVFVPELHEPLRPHPGQASSAANMLKILEGSGIVASHRTGDSRIQDAYSLRCAPQVTGGARDTAAHAMTVAERELAAAVDNPVVLDDGTVSSNGNFLGAPIAYVLDFMAIPLADLASMAERRTDRMLDPARSHGLPPFLAEDPGTDSGLMIAQYTQAGLVSDMKRLAVPVSVDSIPSSAMQEDHVSMGWHAARKLRQAVSNLRSVLAIELLAATRAIALRAPLEPGAAASAVLREIEGRVGGPGPDKFLAPDIESVEEYLASGEFLRTVEGTVGPLH